MPEHTEDTRDSQALRESEARLQLAMSLARAATWDVDCRSGRTIWSESYFRILGYEPTPGNEPRPEMWLELVPPEDLGAVLDAWQHAAAERTIYRCEHRVRRVGDGELLWLRATGQFVYDEHGQPVRFLGVFLDITEEKRREEALRESEARMRAFVTASSDVIYRTNPDWSEVHVVEGRHLVPGSADFTRSWFRRIHPDDRTYVRDAIDKGIRSQASIELEYRVRRERDGAQRWIFSRAVPVLDEAGRIVEWIGSATDVTARRDAHDRLAEHARMQRLLADVADLAAKASDAETLVRDVCARVAKEFRVRRCGLTRVDAAAGQLIVVSDYHDGAPSLAGTYPIERYAPIGLEDALAGRTVVFDDIMTDPRASEIYRAAYAPLHVRAHITVPLLEDGRWVAQFTAMDDAPHTWTDGEIETIKIIASRVWAAVERQRMEEAVRRSETEARAALTELEGIYEHAPIGLCVLDRELRYVRINEYLAAMHQLPREAHIGRTAREMVPHVADQIERVAHQMLETGEPVRDLEVAGALATDPARKRTWLEQWFPLVRDDAVVGINVVVEEITDKREAERERETLLRQTEAARADAEAANRAKDEFLATVSHELRSPLQGILGWLAVLKTGQLEEVETAHALDAVERSVWLQAQLVHDIMDASRIAAGKIALARGLVDVTTIVGTTIDEFLPAAQEKDVLLAFLEGDGGLVTGDHERLHQVFSNLLGNALKFTPPGGRVTVRCARDGDASVVTVTDTGEGIDAEFVPHLFQRFMQADKTTTRRHGGLGLGLAIVKHLVELHGGTVRAASEGPGRGATFEVRLPQAVPRAQTDGAHPSRTPLPTIRLDGVDVLLVEDDREALEATARALRTSGAKIRPAASVGEAWSAFTARPPDIVVSDLSMPDEDGYALLRRIQSAPERGVPVIALTGFTRPEDEARVLAAGFAAYVAKPVPPDVLVDVLGKVLIEARATTARTA